MPFLVTYNYAHEEIKIELFNIFWASVWYLSCTFHQKAIKVNYIVDYFIQKLPSSRDHTCFK